MTNKPVLKFLFFDFVLPNNSLLYQKVKENNKIPDILFNSFIIPHIIII